jgi:two-component system OmpR family response regulator
MSITCLLVEDDSEIRQLLANYLAGFGMHVRLAPDARTLRAEIKAAPADVILLDLMLPDGNGLDLCREIRQQRATPIIMLTAQGDPASRIVGLEVGADDYLPKPFEPRELVARIHAVLRRTGSGFHAPDAPVQAPQLRFKGWRFDRLNRQITSSAGLLVQLSGAEFRLLDAFVSHAEEVLSRDRLVALMQTSGVEVNGRSVDLTVSRLRHKLNQGVDAIDLIRTVRGEGYVLASAVSRA